MSQPIISTISSERVLEGKYLPIDLITYLLKWMICRLIAIMLGRLRMPIDECLSTYEDMGPRIFAKAHRRRWIRHFRDLNYHKWSEVGLEQAIKELINRKSPILEPDEKRTQFSNIKSPPDLSRV